MSTWVYECRACDGPEIWRVSRERVDEMPAEVRVLRVKTSAGWRCAVVDRRRVVAVEGLLLRDAVASDPNDCPGCAAMLVARDSAAPAAPAAIAERLVPAEPVMPAVAAAGGGSAQVLAAEVSLAGRQVMVVLVGIDLVRSPGEADMLAADLRARLGGVDVVLMAQDDDGTAQGHGEPALLALLAGMPVENLPWKTRFLA